MIKGLEFDQARHDFRRRVYWDHLAEASFLFEQRCGLFRRSDIAWRSMAATEKRLEANLDALMVGGDLALEVCRQQAVEGDPSELQAAVCVFCRQDRMDLVVEALKAFDPRDAERIKAVSDALNHETIEKSLGQAIQIIQRGNSTESSLLARGLGYRRLSDGMALLQVWEKNRSVLSQNLVWALGRLRPPAARLLLLDQGLESKDEAIRVASAMSLLRLGEFQAVNRCLQLARSETWPLLPLGLGGGLSAVRVLLEVAATTPSPDSLTALGLLGDVSAVEVLLSHLLKPDLSLTAAQSLNLITGAEIGESVFISEPVDEDELFSEEIKKQNEGATERSEAQQPKGNTIIRLSQKIEDWRKWWSDNKTRFNPKIRYRHGEQYSPACLLEYLESPKSPYAIRQLAYEELVIRYHVDFPFEADMFVSEQNEALSKYRAWINANAQRFQEGKWYFAGQAMPF